MFKKKQNKRVLFIRKKKEELIKCQTIKKYCFTWRDYKKKSIINHAFIILCVDIPNTIKISTKHFLLF